MFPIFFSILNCLFAMNLNPVLYRGSTLALRIKRKPIFFRETHCVLTLGVSTTKYPQTCGEALQSTLFNTEAVIQGAKYFTFRLLAINPIYNHPSLSWIVKLPWVKSINKWSQHSLELYCWSVDSTDLTWWSLNSTALCLWSLDFTSLVISALYCLLLVSELQYRVGDICTALLSAAKYWNFNSFDQFFQIHTQENHCTWYLAII